MANSSIDYVPLDFDGIQNSLRNALKDNDQFKDYDFEGANIKLLLELLAVNAQRTAFYQNMVLNESFLDSAELRNSTLSRAKDLNYLPDSVRSSRARILVEFTATGESAPYIIPKGALLTSLVKNDSFTFSIPESITVASANNTYQFETDIYEGFYVTDTYTFQGNQTDQRFEITNKNVDLNSMTVTVYEDGNEVGDVYVRKTTLLDLNDKSKVYFLQPSQFGYYEVRFGDNNLGRKPKAGSTIVFNYRISQGDIANGARVFTLDFDPTGNDELTGTSIVNTLQDSRDGAAEETIESIKFMAPRHFQTQERAVTSPDYSVMLKKQFPEINAVHTYGGESVTPKRYGRVYCAVDISGVDGLPDSKKQQYADFLQNRTTFGLRPTFVEPEFVYLQINTKVRYNVNITDASQETIKTYVKDAVKTFRDSYLDDFNVILRQSKLETDIDNADASIISSSTDIRSYKKFNPTLARLQDWEFRFGAKFKSNYGPAEDEHSIAQPTTIRSSAFFYNSEQAVLSDDGEGIVRVMRNSGNKLTKIIDIGTVDYENGIVKLKDLKVDNFIGSSIKVYVRMDDVDVSARLNNILTIEDDEINVTPEIVRV